MALFLIGTSVIAVVQSVVQAVTDMKILKKNIAAALVNLGVATRLR